MDPQAGSLFRSLTISRPQSAAPMLPPMNWQNSGGRPKSFPRSTAEIQDFDAPVKLASRRPVSPLPLFLCKQYDASTKYALRHSRRCLSRNAFPAHDAPVRTSESHTLCSTLFGKRHPCKTKKKTYTNLAVPGHMDTPSSRDDRLCVCRAWGPSKPSLGTSWAPRFLGFRV